MAKAFLLSGHSVRLRLMTASLPCHCYSRQKSGEYFVLEVAWIVHTTTTGYAKTVWILGLSLSLNTGAMSSCDPMKTCTMLRKAIVISAGKWNVIFLRKIIPTDGSTDFTRSQ